MVRMEALHPTAMPDDIVAQLQVIVVTRRFIAKMVIKWLVSFSFYVIKLGYIEQVFARGPIHREQVSAC